MLVRNTPYNLKGLLLRTSVVNDCVIGLHRKHPISLQLPKMPQMHVSIACICMFDAPTQAPCQQASKTLRPDMSIRMQATLTLRSVVLGPWLAKMSYSMSPPVMSKPMNCTFLVALSSAARDLHRIWFPHISVLYAHARTDTHDQDTLAAMYRNTSAPVGDCVLQAVVDSWAVLGRAVLAAEEAAVVLLVLAPALQALALVLLCNSDGVDELDVGVPAPMTSIRSLPCSCQGQHVLQCRSQCAAELRN